MLTAEVREKLAGSTLSASFRFSQNLEDDFPHNLDDDYSHNLDDYHPHNLYEDYPHKLDDYYPHYVDGGDDVENISRRAATSLASVTPDTKATLRSSSADAPTNTRCCKSKSKERLPQESRSVMKVFLADN